jgi:hypothetical protein
MPEVLAEISKLDDVDAACALFIIATAVRCGTARGARWGKMIDPEKKTWTIPLEAVKGNKKAPPVVPLSSLAIKVTRSAPTSSAPITEATFSKRVARYWIFGPAICLGAQILPFPARA